ncbi:protein lethal(2)essential for life-like [Orussus abietinus]|uniref:protein lethal(2)essential for life-like n=1 Tax=Orussus abietinus TaxID=222816 RepID=UPI000625324F|nr:protein lethal(2)essential for life-like [Orussus abietinus]
MSLVPLLFSDWWEDLDRPHRLFDQHFGLPLNPEDLFEDAAPNSAEILLYRPQRRTRRRYHPFLQHKSLRRGRGASTVDAQKDKFQVTLDVQQFSPEEVTVKVVDKNVVIEGKHEEKEDEHGWISRQFVRKYMIPEQCDVDKVESSLSSDGVLTVTAPRKEALKGDTAERPIKIQYTGQPAVTHYNGHVENDESHKEEAQTQRDQTQQRTQGQRGKKAVKT